MLTESWKQTQRPHTEDPVATVTIERGLNRDFSATSLTAHRCFYFLLKIKLGVSIHDCGSHACSVLAQSLCHGYNWHFSSIKLNLKKKGLSTSPLLKSSRRLCYFSHLATGTEVSWLQEKCRKRALLMIFFLPIHCAHNWTSRVTTSLFSNCNVITELQKSYITLCSALKLGQTPVVVFCKQKNVHSFLKNLSLHGSVLLSVYVCVRVGGCAKPWMKGTSLC